MMTPHDFFRNAATQRRKALVDFAMTGKTLQELVVSEMPVFRKKKRVSLTPELREELLILKTEVI